MKIITIVRKPFPGSVASNVLTHGSGAINVDGTRIGTTRERLDYGLSKAKRSRGTVYGEPTSNPNFDSHKGRWPANIVLIHEPGCKQIGSRKVRTGTAVRHRSGGKTIFSETEKPTMEDLTYAGPDGKEETVAWKCVDGCAVKEMDCQSGERPVSGSAHRGGTTYNLSEYNGLGKGYGQMHDDAGTASRFFKQVKDK